MLQRLPKSPSRTNTFTDQRWVISSFCINCCLQWMVVHTTSTDIWRAQISQAPRGRSHRVRVYGQNRCLRLQQGTYLHTAAISRLLIPSSPKQRESSPKSAKYARSYPDYSSRQTISKVKNYSSLGTLLPMPIFTKRYTLLESTRTDLMSPIGFRTGS